METTKDFFGWWQNAMDSSLPFWQSWSHVSEQQKDICSNYSEAFGGQFERMVQLAPNNLSQTINPWSFSLFQFTSQIKGKPMVERKILTEVAGYGSQLGTIMDFLDVVARNCGTQLKELQNPDDKCKMEKFQKLLQDINRAKGSAA